MKEGWKVKTLGEVATLQRGLDLPTQNRVSGDYPVVSSSGIIGSHHKPGVAGPCVATGRSGSIGNVFYLEADFWPLNTALYVKDFHGNNPRFVYYLLQQFDLARFTTGSGVPTLNRNFVHNESVLVPPLPEQQRIVALLDDAFDGIATAKANAEQNLKNARELFESHLQAVFTQRGEGWIEKPLGELCERITKGSSPKWQGISYVEEPGILFVTSENVGEYELILAKLKYVETQFNVKDKKSILKRGDVLTNIVGASIGRTAIFDRDDVANINQAVCLLRCKPTMLNNHYLAYLLNSPVFKQILHENEVNNARANLSLSFFSNLAVPLPRILEQQEIVQKLDLLRQETQRLETIYQQKLAALDELKKSLLHKAFNGEL